jgi:hypothetical protein
VRLLVAAAVLAGCGGGIEPPAIQVVAPSTAPRGAEVTIRGAGFCEPEAEGGCAPFSGSVAFGIEIPQVRAVPVTWTEDTIRAPVPQSVDVGPTHIIVTVDGRSSNAADFTVAP